MGRGCQTSWSFLEANMEVSGTPVLVVLLLTVTLSTAQEILKFCVNETVGNFCNEMKEATNLQVDCVTGQNELDCMRLVRDGQADIVKLKPSEIYTAGFFFNLTLVATNLVEQSEVPYKYRTVVIVRNGSGIKKLEDLKGKKSCFSTVGTVDGWEIPIGILLNRITGIDCKNGNELTSIGSYFKSSCAAGSWSRDAQMNEVLKKENKDLCSLCKNPESCDNSDYYADVYGPLNCLAYEPGDVGFTTVEHLEQYSKLNHSEYSFLCLNDTVVPLDPRNLCIWAEMPTTGYMSRDKKNKSSILRELLAKVNNFTQTGSHQWIEYFFGHFKKIQEINTESESWQKYLGNYLNVFNRTLSCEKKLRFCTISDEETKKCNDFKMAAYGQYLRPVVECVQTSSSDDCIAAINKGDADVITLSGRDVYKTGKYEQMLPIVSEEYPEEKNISYYAVAVVKADSHIEKLEDLKDKKSCHTTIGKNAGWIIPISEMMKLGLMDKKSCDVAKVVAGFFSESCAPGAKDKEYNPKLSDTDKLCKLCKDADKCSTSDEYAGYEGAFRCLVEGGGDVSFVKHTTVPSLTDGKSSLEWAKDLKSSDYKLLCPGGTTAAISEYLNCNLGSVPSSRFVVTSNKMEYFDRVNAVYMLTSSGELFGRNSSIFQLFGSYDKKSDLLFKDSAISLKSVSFNSKYDQVLNQDYLEALKLTDPKKCSSASTAVTALSMIICSVLLSLFM